jgi:cystathionine gamma-synthase
MRIVDIRKVTAKAREAGAKTIVDNTFLSPALQRPIGLGADLVVHSTTKFLNGHSDVVGGIVVAATQKDVDALQYWANCTGVTGSPFDAFLTLRGVRTLFTRVEAQQKITASIVAFLNRHPAVRVVHYPGLPTHPGHDIATAQQSGFGSMLSFELAGGTDAVRRFVETVELFTLAESLGGIESLVSHPATMTHASMSADAQRAAGINESLVRLSIGLENEADLVADLAYGLDAAMGRPG